MCGVYWEVSIYLHIWIHAIYIMSRSRRNSLCLCGVFAHFSINSYCIWLRSLHIDAPASPSVFPIRHNSMAMIDAKSRSNRFQEKTAIITLINRLNFAGFSFQNYYVGLTNFTNHAHPIWFVHLFVFVCFYILKASSIWSSSSNWLRLMHTMW